MKYASVLRWRLLALLGFVAVPSAQAAVWRSVLVEEAARISVDREGYPMPDLPAADDGSLRAYPLWSQLAGDIEGDSGMAMVAGIGIAGGVATQTAWTSNAHQLGTLLADGALMTISWTIICRAADGSLAKSIANPDNPGGGVIDYAGGNALLVIYGRVPLQFRQLAFNNGRLLDTVDVE